MKDNKMPRWLELQAEIDYYYYVLGRMYEEEKNLSPIAMMIDEATEFDKKKLKDAKNIIIKIEKLKKEFRLMFY